MFGIGSLHKFDLIGGWWRPAHKHRIMNHLPNLLYSELRWFYRKPAGLQVPVRRTSSLLRTFPSVLLFNCCWVRLCSFALAASNNQLPIKPLPFSPNPLPSLVLIGWLPDWDLPLSLWVCWRSGDSHPWIGTSSVTGLLSCPVVLWVWFDGQMCAYASAVCSSVGCMNLCVCFLWSFSAVTASFPACTCLRVPPSLCYFHGGNFLLFCPCQGSLI